MMTSSLSISQLQLIMLKSIDQKMNLTILQVDQLQLLHVHELNLDPNAESIQSKEIQKRTSVGCISKRMVDKIDVALIIICLLIIVIVAIYLLLCYRWNLYPYTKYERVIPPNENAIMVANKGEPLTAEEMKIRRDNARDFCQAMSNTENFMSIYCKVPSKFGGINCDDI
jgi:hypothetical protein